MKELAQEAKFIRHEENKIKSKQKIAPLSNFVNGAWTEGPDPKSWEWRKLHSHRTHEVREAARAAQLAYGFLRGIPYSKIESKRKQEKKYRFKYDILPEVKRLAKKFGELPRDQNYDEEIENWIKIS